MKSKLQQLPAIFLAASTLLVLSSCGSETGTASTFGNPAQAITQPQQNSDNDMNPDLVRIASYEICSAPGNIVGADESGCMKTNFIQAQLLWGPVSEGRMYRIGTQPATHMIPEVDFGLSIKSRGCFPNASSPQQEGYYSMGSITSIRPNSPITMKIETAPVTNQEAETIKNPPVALPQIYLPGSDDENSCQLVNPNQGDQP